jgi:alkyl hydroperoxide reductase subunit D
MLKDIKTQIPAFGRDIASNIDMVMSESGSQGMTKSQIWGVALACAYNLGSKDLIQAILNEWKFDDNTVKGCKTAATMMAMTNVYFRAMHLINDPNLGKLAPKLAMSSMAEPGIPSNDFQLMCMGVSAIAGCGVCMTMKLAECRKLGISDQAVQSALQIGAVMKATDCAWKIK